LPFSGVDRDRVRFLVLLQQTLVHCAAFEVEAGGLQAEEAQVAVIMSVAWSSVSSP
jgi:hypothetical protein